MAHSFPDLKFAEHRLWFADSPSAPESNSMSMSQSGKGLIEKPEQLAQYFCDGCKLKSNWLIGTKHEKFGFRRSDHRSLPYDGCCSIKIILEGLRDRFGWESAQKKSRRRPDHNQSLNNDK